MARFDMSGLDPIIDEMRAIGEESGAVAQEMILAMAEAVQQAWKRAAEEHDHRVTGDMIRSIGYPKGVQNIGDAITVDIYPQGKDQHGVRNVEKAFLLHYGTSKLKASYWVDTADAYSEQTAIPAAEQIWDKFIQSRS